MKRFILFFGLVLSSSYSFANESTVVKATEIQAPLAEVTAGDKEVIPFEVIKPSVSTVKNGEKNTVKPTKINKPLSQPK